MPFPACRRPGVEFNLEGRLRFITRRQRRDFEVPQVAEVKLLRDYKRLTKASACKANNGGLMPSFCWSVDVEDMQ
jgi:hypothetical protein